MPKKYIMQSKLKLLKFPSFRMDQYDCLTRKLLNDCKIQTENCCQKKSRDPDGKNGLMGLSPFNGRKDIFRGDLSGRQRNHAVHPFVYNFPDIIFPILYKHKLKMLTKARKAVIVL